MASSGITQLQWYLDFLDTELAHLSAARLDELSKKLEIIVRRSDVDRAATGSFTSADIEGFQQRLRERFGVITHKMAELENYQEEQGRPSAEADFYPQFEMLDQDMKITVRVGSQIPHDVLRHDEEGATVRPKPNAIDEAPFELAIHANSGPEETLLFHFLRSFDNVRIGALRQCLECEKWFVHESRRKRKYCTGRCASRRINRDKRAMIKSTDPAAYQEELRKGAERAHRSYKKRTLAKVSAKVQRKPIKHKSEEL
jgi:hypothetical protein